MCVTTWGLKNVVWIIKIVFLIIIKPSLWTVALSSQHSQERIFIYFSLNTHTLSIYFIVAILCMRKIFFIFMPIYRCLYCHNFIEYLVITWRLGWSYAQRYASIIVFEYFLYLILVSHSDQSNWKEKGFTLAHSSEVPPIMMGNHGNRSLGQMVTVHLQSGSRGRWMLVLGSFSPFIKPTQHVSFFLLDPLSLRTS